MKLDETFCVQITRLHNGFMITTNTRRDGIGDYKFVYETPDKACEKLKEVFEYMYKYCQVDE